MSIAAKLSLIIWGVSLALLGACSIPEDGDGDIRITGPCGAPLLEYEDEFGELGFIEYRAGVLPLILGAPHGGYLEPDSLPNIADGLSSDGGSLATTELISDFLFEKTGYRPHVIINHVKRNRLNLNRSWEKEPNFKMPEAIQAHEAWDFFIARARERVTADCGFGAYFDIHTKGAEVNIGIGMGIEGSSLEQPDAVLNDPSIWEKSTVRSLVNRVSDPVASIRGPLSLGGLLSTEDRVVIPSPTNPSPNGVLYYYAGHNVWEHGSRYEGTIDGYHIEFHYKFINAGQTKRIKTAEATAEALVVWLQSWYGVNYKYLASDRAFNKWNRI